MQCAFGDGVSNVRYSYPFAPEAQPVSDGPVADGAVTEPDSPSDDWYCPYMAPGALAGAAPVPLSPASTLTENSDDPWVVWRSERLKGKAPVDYKC